MNQLKILTLRDNSEVDLNKIDFTKLQNHLKEINYDLITLMQELMLMFDLSQIDIGNIAKKIIEISGSYVNGLLNINDGLRILNDNYGGYVWQYLINKFPNENEINYEEYESEPFTDDFNITIPDIKTPTEEEIQLITTGVLVKPASELTEPIFTEPVNLNIPDETIVINYKLEPAPDEFKPINLTPVKETYDQIVDSDKIPITPDNLTPTTPDTTIPIMPDKPEIYVRPIPQDLESMPVKVDYTGAAPKGNTDKEFTDKKELTEIIDKYKYFILALAGLWILKK